MVPAPALATIGAAAPETTPAIVAKTPTPTATADFRLSTCSDAFNRCCILANSGSMRSILTCSAMSRLLAKSPILITSLMARRRLVWNLSNISRSSKRIRIRSSVETLLRIGSSSSNADTGTDEGRCCRRARWSESIAPSGAPIILAPKTSAERCARYRSRTVLATARRIWLSFMDAASTRAMATQA